MINEHMFFNQAVCSHTERFRRNEDGTGQAKAGMASAIAFIAGGMAVRASRQGG
jgi:hypothetical protein